MREFATYRVPSGVTEAAQFYGPPGTQRDLTEVMLPEPVAGVRKLFLHPLAAEPFGLLFRRIHEDQLWHLVRAIEGPTVRRRMGFPPSYTGGAFGAGIMINRQSNPHGSAPMESSDNTRFHKAHPIVLIAQEMGFRWGGAMVPPECASFDLM